MSERVQTGHRGVYRFRAVFFSEDSRLEAMSDTGEAEKIVRQRLRESVRQRNAATFLIADCRLAEISNPVVGLLPAELRVRLSSSLRHGAEGKQSKHRDNRTLRRWRTLLPWVTAVLAAGAGFWGFLYRTL